jgi:transposase
MLRPAYAKWDQKLEDLLQLSMEADNQRSRERYLALYMIGTGQSNATQWAEQIGRENQTVMGWVHRYNVAGPEGVAYQHSGGRTPFLPKMSKLKSSEP